MTIGLTKAQIICFYELPDLLFKHTCSHWTLITFKTLIRVWDIRHINEYMMLSQEITLAASFKGVRYFYWIDKVRSGTDPGNLGNNTFISILVNGFILLILFLICVLQSFKHFGTLILLGWDKKRIMVCFFKKFYYFNLYYFYYLFMVWFWH